MVMISTTYNLVGSLIRYNMSTFDFVGIPERGGIPGVKAGGFDRHYPPLHAKITKGFFTYGINGSIKDCAC